MTSDSVEQPASLAPSGERRSLADICGWLESHLRGAAIVVVWVAFFQVLFAIYLPALPGPFVYDDEGGIVTNADLRFPGEPWRLLRDHDSSLEFDRRPVAGLLTLIDFQLWGLRPSGYRITNVLLHFGCGIAVAALISSVSAGFGCRFPRLYGHLVALLWLVHPLSTSTVSFIYQRSEMLMSLFFVLSLLCLYRAHGSGRKWRWLSGSLICAFLSALSKEPGLTLIVALPLFERICVFGTWKEMWRARKVYYLILVIGIGDITWWVLTGVRMADLDKPEYLLSHPWEYFKTQCTVLARYLKLVVWPHPLIFVSVPDDASRFPQWFPSFAFLTSAVAILLWAGLRKPWIWLCLGGFLIILAPTSSFVPIVLEPEAEFRMYLPSMFVLAGLIAALGPRMLRINHGKTLAAGLFMFAVAASLIGSTLRNRTYSSAVALWMDTIEKSPRSGRAWANLGMAAIRHGHFGMARQCAGHLISEGHRQQSPELVVAGERVAAFVELEDGDPEKAMAMFRKLADDDPGEPGVGLGLAAALERSGRPQDALLILERHHPDPLNSDPAAARLYREIYLALGLPDEAGAVTAYLERLMPGFASSVRKAPRSRHLDPEKKGASPAHDGGSLDAPAAPAAR